MNNVLSDKETLGKYTQGKSSYPSGKFEKLYNDDISKIVLYKIVKLVYFLDIAKNNRVLEHQQCLFRVSSEHKTTKSVLQSLCRILLSGEGDFIKHLASLEIHVNYQQQYIDEYKYIIDLADADKDNNNKALYEELKDGVKITRIVEILVGEKDMRLSKLLRVPAGSRLQKLHNVNLGLKRLEVEGFNLEGLEGRDIVDGKGIGLESLLWRLMVVFKLGGLVDVGVLKDELKALERRISAKGKSVKSVAGLDVAGHDGEALEGMLLQWCTHVATLYNLPCNNFVESFSDGRILLILLHHYHPMLVSRKDILWDVNERGYDTRNILVAKKRMNDLGGIPRILGDVNNTMLPSKQSIVGCVAYLFNRLIESCKLVKAAVVVQRAVRGWIGVKFLEGRREYAVVIQRWFRKYIGGFRRWWEAGRVKAVAVIERFAARNKVRRVRREKDDERIQLWNDCCDVIGRSYRCYSARNALRCLKDDMARIRRCSAVKIQSVYRMYNCKYDVDVRYASVVIIQANMRRKLTNIELGYAKYSAVLIQSIARRNMAQIEYCLRKICAGFIQRVYRGHLGRRIMRMRIDEINHAVHCLLERQLVEHNSAVLLQACFRGYNLRNDIFFNRFAAGEIQRVYRGHVAYNSYARVVCCCVAIQSLVRMWAARGGYSNRRNAVVSAAVVLQKCARGNRLRKSKLSGGGGVDFGRFRLNCVVIQKYYRCYKQRKEFSDVRKCVVRLQCVVRGLLAETYFKACISNVVKLQSAVRRYKDRKNFDEVAASVAIIQNAYRSYKAMCRDKNVYKRQIDSITLLQTLARKKSDMSKYKKVVQSVVSIQKWARCCVKYMDYCVKRYATIVIQRHVRSMKTTRMIKLSYENYISCVVVMQSLMRCKMCSKKLKDSRNAATVLQKYTRSKNMRNSYKVFVGSVVKIQNVYRSMALSRVAKSNFEKTRRCIVIIQAIVRSKISKNIKNKAIQSAIVIQSFIRGYQTRLENEIMSFAATEIQRIVRGSRQEVAYMMTLLATIKVQSFMRMDAARTNFAIMKLAVSIIQSAWRTAKIARGKKEQAAAVVLQSFVRSATRKAVFVAQKSSVTVIQALVRCHVKQRSYKKSVGSVVLVQALVRSRIAASRLCEKKAAATIVQKATRGHLVRLELAISHFAVTEIQRMVRGSQQHIKYILTILGAIKVQSVIRMDIARTNLALAKMAVSMIQRVWRTALVAKHDKALAAVTSIQACSRAFLGKRSFAAAKAAATRVQSVMRAGIARRQFRCTRQRVVEIQAVVRMGSAKLLLRRSVAVATKLQALARGVAARSSVEFMNFAASIVQKQVRAFAAKNKFTTLKKGMVKIQALARKHFVQTHMQLCAFAAMMIQAHARKLAARREANVRREMIKEGKVRELTRQNNAKVLQRGVKVFLKRSEMKRAGARIVKVARGFLGLVRAAKRFRLITCLQGIWRGRKTRKYTGKRIGVIRLRLALANEKAMQQPEMRLGARCMIALDVLLQSKSLAKIMSVMNTLEMSTRHSERCCEMFAAANAPTILFKLIRSCNRSLPHIELLNSVLRTIHHVAMWDHLVDSVAIDNMVDIILDLVQTFRDRDNVLGPSCMILRRVFATDAKTMQILSKDGNVQRLTGALGICIRKENITQMVSKRGTTKLEHKVRGKSVPPSVLELHALVDEVMSNKENSAHN
jgi:abnormal spindle-like microcephaly-associated protein